MHDFSCGIAQNRYLSNWILLTFPESLESRQAIALRFGAFF